MEEDGCGVIFSRDEESDEEYLLIQRHFEEPDDGRPYIETDDERFSGHFRNVAATLDRGRLEVRYGSHLVTVALSVSEEDFQGVAKAMRAMIPDTRLEGSGAIVAQNGG
jgi:hypothetical protein